jgi:tRNA(fMet)-specific endonuclease VapC
LEYLLDTNTCSHIQARHPSVCARLAALPPADRVYTSVIAQGEMLYGAHRQSEPRRGRLLRGIRDFLNTMSDVLPLTRAVADRYAQARARLAADGTPIPVNDLWMAAIALEAGLTLVSDDAHFDRVPGLTVENWVR